MRNQCVLDVVPPYSDCDPSGFVHHCCLLCYAERGRMALMKANNVTVEIAEGLGCRIATWSISGKFTAPVLFGQIIRVRTEVVRVSEMAISTAWVMECYSLDDRKRPSKIVRCGDGIATNTFLDFDGKPKRLPDEIWDGGFRGAHTVAGWEGPAR